MLALLAALLVSPLALAPRAEAFVYWTNQSDGTIGRADLDGTGVDERSSAASQPGGRRRGCAARLLDGRVPREMGPRTIARARLDGTGRPDIHPRRRDLSATEIGSIAVDEDHIYWAENSGHGVLLPPLGSIGRANLDGTGVDQSFIPFPADKAAGVAVDATTSTGATGDHAPPIGRANLDGTGVDHTFIPFPSGFTPGAVEVDAAHIYWFNARPTYPSEGTPSVAPTSTEPASTRASSAASGSRHRADLAVDAGHIYWAAPTPA